MRRIIGLIAVCLCFLCLTGCYNPFDWTRLHYRTMIRVDTIDGEELIVETFRTQGKETAYEDFVVVLYKTQRIKRSVGRFANEPYHYKVISSACEDREYVYLLDGMILAVREGAVQLFLSDDEQYEEMQQKWFPAEDSEGGT